MISIHALREEGDSIDSKPWIYQRHFYPRPPRGGRRNPLLEPGMWRGISIHALREEGDDPAVLADAGVHYFYPRPPRGGRRTVRRRGGRDGPISIHALREEGDRFMFLSPFWVFKFLSTPSARRATACPPPMWTGCRNFYPRPPRGGRLHSWGYGENQHSDFYPRPPRGGRQDNGVMLDGLTKISIHALREEGDLGGSP